MGDITTAGITIQKSEEQERETKHSPAKDGASSSAGRTSSSQSSLFLSPMMISTNKGDSVVVATAAARAMVDEAVAVVSSNASSNSNDTGIVAHLRNNGNKEYICRPPALPVASSSRKGIDGKNDGSLNDDSAATTTASSGSGRTELPSMNSSDLSSSLASNIFLQQHLSRGMTTTTGKVAAAHIPQFNNITPSAFLQYQLIMLGMGGSIMNNIGNSNNRLSTGILSRLQQQQPKQLQSSSNQFIDPGVVALMRGGQILGTGLSDPGHASTTTSLVEKKNRQRSPMIMYMDCDEDSLSEYQCILRKQIEIFEAGASDAALSVQGRNKQIVQGQVGIRCRHCSRAPDIKRQKGSMYFPTKLDRIYQAAQNLSAFHLSGNCEYCPADIREKILLLRERKSPAGGGKHYWAEGVRCLGVIEDQNGLRFK